MATLHPHHCSWRPPFCPNPNCKYHKGNTPHWHYKKAGLFHRLNQPHRIQRFTCLHCHRYFSSQTFCTTYWQKQPDLDRKIFMKTVGCMGNRQLSRDQKICPETVHRHLSRLGRHCLLFHLQMIKDCPAEGPIVIDGFESFEYSQYFPMHFHLAVEARTGFFLGFTDSELRRKGRMTAAQKRRRQQLEKRLGRPDPQAIEKDVHELLSGVLQGVDHVVILSDDHRAYPRAMRGLDCQICHQVTSSKQRRDAQNPLFEINALDLLLRHSSANHKRETIAWSKRRQSSAERLLIFQAWRNYVKKRREKGPWQTAAMQKGLTQRPLTVDDILKERLFRTRMDLPRRWSLYYDRRVHTRALAVNRTHDLRYAY